MLQPATLIDQEAVGRKKISTYFCCDVSNFLLLLLLTLQRGRWSVVVNEACSGG
jgi:hypothetical protein